MDKETAKALIKLHRRHVLVFNAITDITVDMVDVSRAKKIRKAIADVTFLLEDAVVVPIKLEFPDLVKD